MKRLSSWFWFAAFLGLVTAIYFAWGLLASLSLWVGFAFACAWDAYERKGT